MREDAEGLLEVPYGLAVGRPHHSLLPSLPTVRQGLGPQLAPQGMVRQAFNLLSHAVFGERFENLHDAGMKHTPPLLEQPPIGHLMRQGVLEGVGMFREEARLVEKLGRLEVRQAVVERRLREFGDGLEQGHGHLGANHGGGLEEAFLLGGQPVNAGRQDHLHGRGHVEGVERLRQPIRPRCPDQEARLHQRADALF